MVGQRESGERSSGCGRGLADSNALTGHAEDRVRLWQMYLPRSRSEWLDIAVA
jgi:hypothetical protein